MQSQQSSIKSLQIEKHLSIEEVYKIITTDRELKRETDIINQTHLNRGFDDYDKLKRQIQCIIGGISPIGLPRSNNNLSSLTHIQIDIDFKKYYKNNELGIEEINKKVRHIKKILIDSDNFSLIFKSPSSLGLKGLLLIDEPINEQKYKEKYTDIRQYIYNLVQEHLKDEEDVDKNIPYSQTTVLTYDEDCYYNDFPTPLVLNSLVKNKFTKKVNDVKQKSKKTNKKVDYKDSIDIEDINGLPHPKLSERLRISRALLAQHSQYSLPFDLKYQIKECEKIIQKDESVSDMTLTLERDYETNKKTPQKYNHYTEKTIKFQFPQLIIKDEIPKPEYHLINKNLSEYKTLIENELNINNNLIINAPTGSGKTRFFTDYIDKTKYKKILLLVPTNANLDNLRNDELSDNGVLTIKNGECDIRKKVIKEQYNYNVFVTTQDSGYNKLRNMQKEFDLIIFDEAHRLIRDGYRDIRNEIQTQIEYNNISNIKQIMLSGTAINLHFIDIFKLINFKYKDERKINSYTFSNKKDDFVNVLNTKVVKGRKTMIYYNNNIKSYKIIDIKKHLELRGFSVLVINKNENTNINVKNFLNSNGLSHNYDVIISTAYLQDGVSFNWLDNTTYIIYDNSPITIKQYSSRARLSKNIEIYHKKHQETNRELITFNTLLRNAKTTCKLYNDRIEESKDDIVLKNLMHNNRKMKLLNIFYDSFYDKYHICMFDILAHNYESYLASISTEEYMNVLEDYGIKCCGDIVHNTIINIDDTKSQPIKKDWQKLYDDALIGNNNENKYVKEIIKYIDIFGELLKDESSFTTIVELVGSQNTRTNYKKSVLFNYLCYLTNKSDKTEHGKDITNIYELFIKDVNEAHKTGLITAKFLNWKLNDILNKYKDVRYNLPFSSGVNLFKNIYNTQKIKKGGETYYTNLSNKCPIKEEHLRTEFKKVRI